MILLLLPHLYIFTTRVSEQRITKIEACRMHFHLTWKAHYCHHTTKLKEWEIWIKWMITRSCVSYEVQQVFQGLQKQEINIVTINFQVKQNKHYLATHLSFQHKKAIHGHIQNWLPGTLEWKIVFCWPIFFLVKIMWYACIFDNKMQKKIFPPKGGVIPTLLLFCY